jgi:hypothetical protein
MSLLHRFKQTSSLPIVSTMVVVVVLLMAVLFSVSDE